MAKRADHSQVGGESQVRELSRRASVYGMRRDGGSLAARFVSTHLMKVRAMPATHSLHAGGANAGAIRLRPARTAGARSDGSRLVTLA